MGGEVSGKSACYCQATSSIGLIATISNTVNTLRVVGGRELSRP